MEIYSQRDPRWGFKEFSSDNLSLANWGCLVTAVAQALTNAGWEVNPGTLVDQLNAIGGFTDGNHPQGAGLLIWSKVTELYPQFHYGGEGYIFQKGVLGKRTHFVLKQNDQVFDPWTGTNQAPHGFYEVAGSRSAAIDFKPAETPPPAEIPAPPEPVPTPIETPPETPAPQGPAQYIVQPGDTVSEILGRHYGLSHYSEIKAKYPEVARANGVDPNNITDYHNYLNMIRPGQVINLP